MRLIEPFTVLYRTFSFKSVQVNILIIYIPFHLKVYTRETTSFLQLVNIFQVNYVPILALFLILKNIFKCTLLKVDISSKHTLTLLSH